VSKFYRLAAAIRERLRGGVVWNVNSTERGGGVAEMLRSLLGYARGAGVDARWFVIQGTPAFFRLTKRLHHALHGSSGDGSPLGGLERAVYEAVIDANADDLRSRVRSGDVILLHDPQTAGLAPRLLKLGVKVIWRCHIGSDEVNEETEQGWAFLAPYLENVHGFVFSRSAYVPDCCDHGRSVIVPPSIDAFSAKNQQLGDASVRAILAQSVIIGGASDVARARFVREDSSIGRVVRRADVIRAGQAPRLETPLVAQVSRWDPLKDPVGVMHGFARLTEGTALREFELVLVGPNLHAIADDPEGEAVLRDLIRAWNALPHGWRRRVHLALLPMVDVEENAAIVNALQRHARVVVQKSLREGFGLTVTEAMWKGRPVLASAVGGIRDQIVHGTHGVLLEDPTDADGFADALRRLVTDDRVAARLGAAACERVRDRYLAVRHLLQYARLIENWKD
jgi:trehalose synthase